MNEDFIPFEIAKKLKEKGFREKVNAYYGKHGNIFNIHPALDMNDADYRASAPTISQVLKWLREEKEIFIRVTLSYDYSTDADGEQVDRWTFWLFEVFSVGSGSLIYTEEISEYDSYEQAALAGVEYCLDNLI